MNKTERAQLRKKFAAAMHAVFPELRRMPGAIEASVVKQNKSGGAYTVDVQPVMADGSPDDRWPVLPGVPVGTLLGLTAVASGAMFTLAVGTRVVVGFILGDPSRPYLDKVFSDKVPDGNGIVWQIATPDATIRLRDNHNMEIETTGAIKILSGQIEIGSGADEAVVLGTTLAAKLTAHTHPTGAGPSGPSPELTTLADDALSVIAKVAKGAV